MRVLVHFSLLEAGQEPLRFFFAGAQNSPPQAALPFGARVLLPLALGSALGAPPEAAAQLAAGVQHQFSPLSSGRAWIEASLELPEGSLRALRADSLEGVETLRQMIGREIGASVASLPAVLLACERHPEAQTALLSWSDPARIPDLAFDVAFAAVESTHVSDSARLSGASAHRGLAHRL